MNRPKAASPDLDAGHYDLIKAGQDGELQAQPVFLCAPNKKRLATELGGWVICWQEQLMTLAKVKELTKTDLRVLMVLQSSLDFDNWVRLSHADIGRELDVARPNVSVAMKRLLVMNVLLVGPSTRGVNTYRLNPNFSWKGTMRNAVKERRAAPKLTLVQGGKKPADARQPELLPAD